MHRSNCTGSVQPVKARIVRCVTAMVIAALLAAPFSTHVVGRASRSLDQVSRPLVFGARSSMLSIDSNGILRRNGTPYCAIGVNYNDAFWRHLSNPSDRTYEQGFADLQSHGIPFVRIPISGYWPDDMKLYQTDAATFFARVDDVVGSAGAHGIGVIADLYWAWFMVPDLVGEPVSSWGNPDSATSKFMTQFTRDVVFRYRHTSAIWAWEFGNEYSLQVDLPNAASFRPPVVPSLGTPTTRSSADDLTTAMIVTAFEQFSMTVQQLDDRPVTTGNSIPRSEAEQTRKTTQFGALDSRSDFMGNLVLVNPSPGYQLASIHLYHSDITQQRFATGYISSYDELLSLSSMATNGSSAALFAGEFGASDVLDGGQGAAISENQKLIDAIVRNRVPLSAVWVFDTENQNLVDQGWNITFTNSRAPVLQAIIDANRDFQQGSCTAR
jgi:hypothetical protein